MTRGLSGVSLTRLRRIPVAGGDVLHAMKRSDAGFSGFGEAYLSLVEPGRVKGWKSHRVMVLNLVVAAGIVQVCLCDGAGGSLRVRLGPDRPETHMRLTVPPGLWVAFGGAASGPSALLNLASIEHDPGEAETRSLEAFPWLWDAPPWDAPHWASPTWDMPIGATRCAG